MPQTAKRINWIDMAKGYGMLFVILGHIGDFGEFAFFKTWFFSFHMPLFFFLSGYVFKEYDCFKTFLKKKVKGIIVPYFCLGIPMILFQMLWDFKSHTLTVQSGLDLVLKFLLQRRLWTIWFLTCLFLLSLVFYLLKKLIKSDLILAIVSIVLPAAGTLYYHLGGRPLFWNLDVCMMAFPFFFAGYYAKKHRERIHTILEKKQDLILFLLASLAINIAMCVLNAQLGGDWFNMFSNDYGIVPITFISAFAGIGFIIAVSKLATFRLIRYIGENSILYLAWHEVIMLPIAEKILIAGCAVVHISYDNLFILLHYAIILVLIVAFLTVCSLIISKTGLRVILGKSNPPKSHQKSAADR